MRICFLSSMHPPTDKRVFEKEARSLACIGHEVIHLAPGDGREWVQEGVRLVTYHPQKGLAGRLLQLPKLYLWARAIKADVYHCNEVDSWIVGIVLRILGTGRVVFDVHEHYPEDFAEFHCPRWFASTATYIIRKTMHFCALFTDRFVLAKSSLVKEFSYVEQGKVFLVENFVSISSIEEDNTAEKPEGITIIHLGLINRARGLPELLKAISICNSDINLILLGEINDGSEQDFGDYVTSYGIADKVRQIKWLPYDQAMLSVRAADIGIIVFQPGFYNHIHALPHKLFDYMAARLPVIAPDFAVEVAEIVSEADCGLLISPSDPQAIASAIDELASNKRQRLEYGRRGREAVLKRYNWEAEAKKLIQMYEDLMH